jgi:type I restriction enzyme S subunit
MKRTPFPIRTLGSLIEDGAIAEIQDGNHGDKHPTSKDYVEDGIPFLMASDIGNDGMADLDHCKFIPQSLADSLRIGFAREGDVLLTHKGSVGRVAVVPPISNYIMLTPQVTYYRVQPSRLSNRFLSFAFRHPDFQQRMVSLSAQSTRPYIGITAQRQLHVFLPLVTTQRKIASILSAYDDLIENNTRRIAILEAMAQAIYREWFVEFRFPGHENARFVDSPVGKIPEGWHRQLGDIVTLKRGYDLPQRDRRAGDVPLVSSSGITDFHDEAMVTGPGVVTGRYGTLGQVFYIQRSFWPLNTTLYVRDFQGNEPLLVVHLLRSLNLASQNAAGAVPGVNRNALHLLEVVFPPSGIQKSIAPAFDAIENSCNNLRSKNENLRKTRDLLLPKLISGQFDVEDLDIEIGEPLVEAET